MNRQTSLFGIEIDPLSMEEAVHQALGLMDLKDEICRYIVTPNLSHVMIWQENPEFRKAYAGASLVLSDGTPLVIAAHLLGKFLPERISGVDFTEKLLEERQRGSCFLLGAAPGVAERAAKRIVERWPNIEVKGVYSPPFGFEHHPHENNKIIEMIRNAQPEILIIGLGAPKQEVWVYRHQAKLQAKLALCVGATIDFIAGEKKRAPEWMQKTGLEWLYRFFSEPKRLGKRYCYDALRFPALLWKEWRKKE